MKIFFEEKQKFNPIIVWSIIGPLAAYNLLLLLRVFKGLSSIWPLVLGLLVLIFLGQILTASLKTKITDNGISVDFYPILISGKKIKWEEIRVILIRTYSPVKEYGGWGIPFVGLPFARGLGDNRALIAKGNIGIQLILNDGNKLLIGTQKPEEIKMALKSLKNK